MCTRWWANPLSFAILIASEYVIDTITPITILVYLWKRRNLRREMDPFDRSFCPSPARGGSSIWSNQIDRWRVPPVTGHVVIQLRWGGGNV